MNDLRHAFSVLTLTVLGAVGFFNGPKPVHAAASLAFEWPPQVGRPYPDLEMTDQTGKVVHLSTFKGKLLLIEPVGMNCEACLGWSGTETYGPFEGLQGQQVLHPFEESFERVTGLRFDDPRIVHIQLLLFNTKMMPTVADDAKAWAAHFHRDRAKSQIVLAGSAPLLQPPYSQASYNLIPGFQLVDKNFILRSESISDAPKTNLWTELLPMVPALASDVR